eukprot:15363370-Ditylum_brightwellii.AAC.1
MRIDYKRNGGKINNSKKEECSTYTTFKRSKGLIIDWIKEASFGCYQSSIKEKQSEWFGNPKEKYGKKCNIQ